MTVEPSFAPDRHRSPHLTPSDRHLVDQHAFRSPALIVASSERVLALVPDLDVLSGGTPTRWYMDLDAPSRKPLGMSETDVDGHVFRVRKPGAACSAGKVELGFFVLASDSPEDVQNPWRDVLELLSPREGSHDEGARSPRSDAGRRLSVRDRDGDGAGSNRMIDRFGPELVHRAR